MIFSMFVPIFSYSRASQPTFVQNETKLKKKRTSVFQVYLNLICFSQFFNILIWHIFECFSPHSFQQTLLLFSQSRDRLVSTEIAVSKAPAIRAFKIKNADGSENLNSKSLSRCLLFHLNLYVKCGRIRLQVNYQNRIHVQKEKEKLHFLCLPFIRKFHIVLLQCSD